MTKKFKSIGGLKNSVKATLKRKGFELSNEGNKWRYGSGILVSSDRVDTITIEDIGLTGSRKNKHRPDVLEALEEYGAFVFNENCYGSIVEVIRIKLNK